MEGCIERAASALLARFWHGTAPQLVVVVGRQVRSSLARFWRCSLVSGACQSKKWAVQDLQLSCCCCSPTRPYRCRLKTRNGPRQKPTPARRWRRGAAASRVDTVEASERRDSDANAAVGRPRLERLGKTRVPAQAPGAPGPRPPLIRTGARPHIRNRRHRRAQESVLSARRV